MSPDNYNEIELLEASLNGSTTAFEAIVSKYQSYICALTFCAVGDLNQSEELAQETFISAWRNLAQLQDLSKFRSWLCTIAKNAIRSMRRKQQRDLLNQAAPIDYAEGAGAWDSEPARAVASQEQIALVCEAIEKMPANYRIPLVLFYREHRSIKQVAAELDLSEGVVRQRLSRGRKLLKGQIAAMVEGVLSHTGPTQAFTTAVMASIVGLAVKSSPVAAAGSYAALSSTGTSTVLTGLAAKIGTVAAALIISIGAVAVYRHSQNQTPSAEPTHTGTILPGQPTHANDELVVSSHMAEDAQPNVQVESPKRESTPGAEVSQAMPSASPAFGRDWLRPRAGAPPATPTEFTPRGVLSGLITDADTNEPVVGAKVRIYKAGSYLTTTDRHGCYYLDQVPQAGAYRIELSSQEYAWINNWHDMPAVALKPDAQAVKHFCLKRGCQIEVEVVDEEGSPVPRAQVRATWMGKQFGHEVGRSRPSVYTDKGGRAILGAFEPSDMRYLVTAIHNGYAPGKHVAKLTDPHALATGRIVLQKGMTVEGLVQYADGVPAEGLQIYATPDWCNIISFLPLRPIEAGGYFSLQHIVPGIYNINIYAQRPGGGGTAKTVMQAQLPWTDGILDIKLPDPSPGVLVSLSGSVRFIGEHQSRRGVSVSAYSAESGSTFGVVTGGQFRIDGLKPGIHRLTFSGSTIARKVIERVTVPGPELAVELQCVKAVEKPRLRGIVMNAATDKPVPQFRARVMKLRGLHGNRNEPSELWHEFADAQGRFDLEAVGPGIYTVQVAAAGLAWTWSDEINTEQDNPVVIRTYPGGGIKGHVLNAAGEPIPHAKVIPLSRACANRSYQAHLFASQHGAVETMEGRFSLEHLAEGFETLKVVHPDYRSALIEDIEVVNGQATEDIYVTLSSGAVVEGHVYDAYGHAQAGVRLNFQDMHGYRTHQEIGRLASTITDVNGFYRVGHLPAQPCRVMRSDYYRSQGVVCRTVVPSDDETTQLDFGGEGVVTGQVLIDGQPLAQNRMLLGDPYDSQSLDLVAYVTTDAEGRFTFLGVPDGRHGIYYQLPQSRQFTAPDWAKLRTLHKAQDALNLETIQVERGEIAVLISIAGRHDAFESVDVYLQAGTDLWGPRVGTVLKPENAGLPYRISQVPSGVYTVVAKRPDHVQFRRPIQFEAKQGAMAVSLDIPRCTTSVSGMLTRNPQETALLRRSDHKVLGFLVPLSEGHYNIENLPAGEYCIGGHYTINTAPAARFSLLEGETKTINIDTSSWSSINKGDLHTQIVDDQNKPINDAEVWLERDDKRIVPYKETKEGQFFVAEPGEYTLYVDDPSYEMQSRPVKLPGKDLMVASSRGATVIIELNRLRQELMVVGSP